MQPLGAQHQLRCVICVKNFAYYRYTVIFFVGFFCFHIGPPIHVKVEIKVISFGPVDEENQVQYFLEIG